MSTSSGATTLSVSGQPLSALVDSLTSDLSSLVVDRTGLEGMFDFVVEYESQRTAVALAALRPSIASWARVRSNAARLIASPSAATGRAVPPISPVPASACS